MGTIHLSDKDITHAAAGPQLIIDACRQAGLMLDAKCGGQGTCGGCGVDLVAGRFRLGGQDLAVTRDQKPRRVRACQCRLVAEGWEIAVPRRSLVEAGPQAETAFRLERQFVPDATVKKIFCTLPRPTLKDSRPDRERLAACLAQSHGVENLFIPLPVLQQLPDFFRPDGDYALTATVAGSPGRSVLVAVEPGDTTAGNWGLAADIGTTTVALALVDLNRGGTRAAIAAYNQQLARGADVAARISHASRPGGTAELQGLVVRDTVNPLLRSLCRAAGVEPRQIHRMAVAGNTVMSHLFCGIQPQNIGAIPFNPAARSLGPFWARDLGVEINPHGMVDVLPAIAGYVGGDITADIYLSGMYREAEKSLLIDLGTNAEIAVGNRERILACATAAGPAFEGGTVGCARRAAPGAVEAIRLEDGGRTVRCAVIGGGRPAGICGSGLIDFLAQALRAGILNQRGRFVPETAEPSGRLQAGTDERGAPLRRFVVARREETEEGTGDIFLTEKDLADLMQAKAAVFSGTKTLCDLRGWRFADLDALYLAGGFAKNINLENAIAIGLLPDVPLHKIHVLGNGSLAGAFLSLADRTVPEELERIAARPEVVELNLVAGFEAEYTNALFLPHLDPALFPRSAR